MEPDFHDEHFSEIWRGAEHRRAKDIYFWLTHFATRQPSLERPEAGLPHLLSESAVLLHRFLRMPHSASPTAKSGQ
jgi:hypothetical protein